MICNAVVCRERAGEVNTPTSLPPTSCQGWTQPEVTEAHWRVSTGHPPGMWSRMEKRRKGIQRSKCRLSSQKTWKPLKLNSRKVLCSDAVGGSDGKKSIHLQCRRPGFNPWIGKTPWRRRWLPTPGFLPVEFHGQRILAGDRKSTRLNSSHNA